jgi:hypothetical protein
MVVFNASYDPAEKKFKAVQFGEYAYPVDATKVIFR